MPTFLSFRKGTALQAKLKPFALILIVLLSVALAAGYYFMLAQAPFGPCTIGTVGTDPTESNPLWTNCPNYIYYFVGAPLVVGFLLLLILPNLVTREEGTQETKPAPAQPESREAAPPPPPKPTTEAAVQLLAFLHREGR